MRWGPIGATCGEITVHIACSKTDWLNQGCIWSHAKIPYGPENSDLCAAIPLIELRDIRPKKLAIWRGNPIAIRLNRNHINATHLDAILRADIFELGPKSGAFSLHPMRLGDAALYQAARDVELAARFGRCGVKSIFAFLRDSRQMLAGFGDLVVDNAHTLRTGAKSSMSNYGK